MTTQNPTHARGFTLIELMIVVAIIGLLAAVASAAYIKYVQQTKSSEASLNLKALGDSSSQYYQVDQLDANGAPLPLRQFPTPSGVAADNSEGIAPAEVPRNERANVNFADWDTPIWKALKFAPTKAHYYQYRYRSNNRAGGDVAFTARAIGDLDGDGIESDYRVFGISNQNTDNSIQITPVVIDPINPLE